MILSSKRFWANIIGIALTILNSLSGSHVYPEICALLIGVINIVGHIFTIEPTPEGN
nr:MAG: hypothetical protein [Microviridae sp.]